MDYLKGSDQSMLEDLSAKLLIDIGWNPYVCQAIWDAMQYQLHFYLDANPIIYDLAIDNSLITLGVKEKPTLE
jgi:hypothetical protein